MSDDMFYCSFVSIHYIICECGETFPTEEQLKGHLESDHSLKKEKKDYKCGVCEAIFSTEQACIEHYSENHLEIKGEHNYVEQHDYVDELNYVEEQDYVCTEEAEGEGSEICEAIFSTEQACIEHYNENHLEIKEEHNYVEQHDYVDELNYVEEHDYVSTENAEGEGSEIIFEHVIEEKPPQPEPKIRARDKNKDKKTKPYYNTKNIVCEVCGKRYASNAALKYHQRVHTGERPYKCNECPKSFTMPLFLQIHTRTHTGERPYECNHCPKAFSNKAALLRHDRVHTGVKPYECPECGKFFTQSNSMKLHVNTVHLKMPAPYKSKTRRNKAKEREMLREAILRVIDNEDSTAVQTISQTSKISDTEVQFIKPDGITFKEEVEEAEILYEDVDSREITYEVVYEE